MNKNNFNKPQLKKPNIADDIDRLKQRREDRKNKNFDGGKGGNDGGKAVDFDYENMMKKKKKNLNIVADEHTACENSKIVVAVRQRPLSKKEIMNGEIDCVSTLNPRIFVHECKIKVDGITKYIEDQEFCFDNSFNDMETTEDVYQYSVYPTIPLLMNRGIVTCFAYGQTGSGKTFTMKGIQNHAIDSIFEACKSSNKSFELYVSFFEIYGGRLFDLLNNKNKLSVLEDKNQKVQIFGLEEKLATNPGEMRLIIEQANSIRTTHNTVTNETSSRSHAICNIVIKETDSEEAYAKLTLVDLAGSERAQETQSNDRNRRAEGAEINKSLLALKECIRALDARKQGSDTHVPFRASKLTLVLRDSFVSKSDKSKIIMIACVSPAYSSANHTINTLRYSDRLKEKTYVPLNIPKVGPSRLSDNMLQDKIPNNNNYQNMPNNNISYKNNEALMNNIQNRLNNNQNRPQPKFVPKPKDNGDVIMKINTNFDIKMQNDNELFENIMVDDDKFMTPEKDESNDDWEYLKKTVSKEGKYLSDDFIRYHQITDLIVEDEDAIVNTHMNIIKDDAKLLTEEGNLITKIKGLNDDDYQMDAYTDCLERIINKKISIYTDLKKRIETYKYYYVKKRQHIKEEDEIRNRINPKYFMEN